MMIDNSLSFNTNWQTSQVITATVAGGTLIDVTGAGTGIVPSMIGAGGLSSALGVDIGQGDGMAIPYFVMFVGTAFVSAGGATLQVSLLSAPDNGSGSAGTYTQIAESAAIASASLTAGATMIFQVPPRLGGGQPGQAVPRFYKVSYTVASSTFSAGTVYSGFVINPPASLVNTLYGSNFTAV